MKKKNRFFDIIVVKLIRWLLKLSAKQGAGYAFYYSNNGIGTLIRNIYDRPLMEAIQGIIDSDIHDQLGWDNALYSYKSETYTDCLRSRFETIQNIHNHAYPGGPIGMVQLSTESDIWRTND